MAMASNTADGEVMVEMNTTPLIDVMLVLLTLLIITLPIQTHAVKLDMPAPNSTPPTVIPETVELGVDFDGTITWNSVPVDRATMDAYFLNAAKTEPQPEIHVSPNRLAKYDAVAKVLADAQRLGVTHIGFTGIDQYN
ncbi:MAG: biopolymer transporter ExbD [Alphaproteobacteria bacterium]|nr:biopolymer transporter ExbD [Alphaproteobacteria bacterium]